MNRDKVTVIKSVNYGEADKVLTLFGRENGKFTVFAKGIRKINSKNRGNMQTLFTSDISYYTGKGLPVLTESQLIYAPNIDNNLNIDNVKRVLYIMNKFLQEDYPYPHLFDCLQSCLTKNLSLEAVNKFRFIFLNEMGFLGEMHNCKYCGNTENLKYWDNESFSPVCEDCFKIGKGNNLGENPYESIMLTNSLDNYIKRIVEEI